MSLFVTFLDTCFHPATHKQCEHWMKNQMKRWVQWNTHNERKKKNANIIELENNLVNYSMR